MPKVLIRRHAALLVKGIRRRRPARVRPTHPRRIANLRRLRVRFRILKRQPEQRVGIDGENLDVRVRGLESGEHVRQESVEGGDVLLDHTGLLEAEPYDGRRSFNGGDVEDEEVARVVRVEGLEEAVVVGDDFGEDVGRVEARGADDVVDAEPEAEESVAGGPADVDGVVDVGPVPSV